MLKTLMYDDILLFIYIFTYDKYVILKSKFMTGNVTNTNPS